MHTTAELAHHFSACCRDCSLQRLSQSYNMACRAGHLGVDTGTIKALAVSVAAVGRMTHRSIQDAGKHKEEDAVVDLDVDGEACAAHWRPDDLL